MFAVAVSGFSPAQEFTPPPPGVGPPPSGPDDEDDEDEDARVQSEIRAVNFGKGHE
jgi:hypothetical protein